MDIKTEMSTIKVGLIALGPRVTGVENRITIVKSQIKAIRPGENNNNNHLELKITETNE